VKPTIKDVADRAGVSIATVSRVINGAAVVSEKSATRVNAAIKELGFKPNQVARNLVLQKNTSIGIIVPALGNQFYGDILNGIEDACAAQDYEVFVCTTGGDPQKEGRFIETFSDKNCAGIVVMSRKLRPETVKSINALNIPTIMVNRKTSGLMCPTVSIDNFRAAYEITNYLIGLGHKKIALFRNSLDIDAFGVEQYSGFERALAEHNLIIDRDLVCYGEFDPVKSYNLMTELIEKGKVPTAVFATSDVMAMGVCNALFDKGYKVPEDVSVVGFNDIQLAAHYRPALTVIHQPLKQMGEEAVRMIVDMNREDGRVQKDGRTVILPHELIERQSCCSPADEK